MARPGDGMHYPLALWPGITTGFDARCTCTWAPWRGVYQVKARDVMCGVHGGGLEAALARAARARLISGAPVQGEAG